MLNQHFDRMDQQFNEMEQEFSSDRHTKALHGEQARSKYQIVLDEESGEPEDFTAYRGGDTPSENQFELRPISLVRQQTGQHESHLASVFRPVESDQSRASCPDESILRDLPLGESLEGEPVPQSAGFRGHS